MPLDLSHPLLFLLLAMKRFPRVHLAAFAAALGCVSCEPDPALVEKDAQQQLEISRLKDQLSELEKQIEDQTGTETNDFDQATQQSKALATELENLKQEISDLNARKQTLQNEFDSFRAKHPLE